MPATFVVAIIFAILGAILLGVRAVAFSRKSVANSSDGQSVRSGLGWGAIGVGLFAAFMLFLACLAHVNTKEYGVVLFGGKPGGQMTNGYHLKAPWKSVKEIDAAVQTDSYDTDATCIAVRIGNLQTGCAHISIQWQIQAGGVDYLYQNFRSFEHVRDGLVTRNLKAAVNEALSSYNPLTQISEQNPSGQSKALLIAYQGQIAALLSAKVGQYITIKNVILQIVTFDQATQDRINQLQQQVAQTLIAKQQVKTNEQQALANQKIAQSVDTSPNVLVKQCLDILSQNEKDGHGLPTGFSCWPGGGAQAIIANGK